jgi:hypothetical protein
MPVVPDPVVLLLAPQQGCPMPPHAWHTPVVPCAEQYVFGAVQT